MWLMRTRSRALPHEWKSQTLGLVLSVLLGAGFAGFHCASAASSDLFSTVKMTKLSGDVVTPFDLSSLDGTPVRSQDWIGKVVLMNFWATWCGPCKEEMPSLARLQERFDPQQVAVVTVTTDVQRQGITQFLGHLGVKLPVLFDEDQEVSRSFMVRALPTTVLIAQDGRVVGRAVGPRAWDNPQAVALIRQVLEGAPP